MAESARDGVGGITIGGVGNDVDPAAFAAECGAAEADGAVRESLAVVLPVWVAAPAIVDGVAGEACWLVVLCLERQHLPSCDRGIDATAKAK